MTFRMTLSNDFPENGSLELIFPWVDGQPMINSEAFAMPVLQGDMAFESETQSVTDNGEVDTTMVVLMPQYEYFTAGVRPDFSVWPI